MRGDGRIYRDPGSPYWYMAYYVNGRQVRESTRETDAKRARQVLRRRVADVLRGDVMPDEKKLTLGGLVEMLTTDYEVNGRRSLSTIQYPVRHLLEYFGPERKALAVADRLDRYVLDRQREGAATATIRIELALLGRAFTLAARAKKLRARPYIPVPAPDPSRVRQGFLAREQVEALVAKLPADTGDAILFLFWSTWRPYEMRTLQWRDYDRAEQTIRLRPERSKNKYARVLPVEGELAIIIERRWKARRLDCPFIFHHEGQPIGDFRKRWKRACAQVGVDGRIVYDLRRSGVRHLIQAGIDPHTVMAFSGHRTPAMLRRYHIIDVDDLRRAAGRASAYSGQAGQVVPIDARTRRERAE